MTQPIIDPSTLTKEQKERIMEYAYGLKYMFLHKQRPSCEDVRDMLYDLFGSDFFEKGGEG